MNETNPLSQPVTGKCLCGAVQIAVEEMKPEVDIIHCGMCQKWTGSFFGGVKGAKFTVEGESNITAFKSSDWAERAFCNQCGSNLWFRFVPANTYSFLAGLFELPAGFGIEQQIFIEDKPDWFDIKQDSPMKTGEEIIAEAKAAGFDFD